ncbi:MAG: putative PIN and TRAM-domain containing protein YacL [Chloroflexi bacterium]|nr:putative PIN and TRAM-domain containing protein YacL [Chloroflexota bacterium]
MSHVFPLRLIGAIIFGLGGWWLGSFIGKQSLAMEGVLWVALFTLCGAVIGFALAPYPQRWLRGKIKQVPGHTFFAATVGLIVASVLSSILALPLSLLPGLWGKVSPVIVFLVLIYLIISVMVLRSREVALFRGTISSAAPIMSDERDGNVILDTNSIIDGRIADIIGTGFVNGTLLIPKFVLDELHYIADSPDPLRRIRGRRGLDILTRLQRESDIPVQISDMDFKGIHEVDTKLVELAKVLRSAIVTNDVNLSRVASLQGIRVLNVNELANALKPVVLPGDEMRLRIVQEGKELGQGVGFLDDGTMVVVEGGRRYLNTEIKVVVSRVLQTGAGRMIFAHPQSPHM